MKSKNIISANEVSNIYEISLGGMNQKILVEGKTKNLPIVITLHGGPGTPIPFCVGCRGLFPAFTDRFLMVYWDQLGCGINNYEIADKFTIESYVEMTVDLVKFMRHSFPKNPIYLFGMSWGSVLALKTVQACAEINGVVVWGQVVKKLFFNEEVYSALEASNLSQKKMKRIRNINPMDFKPRDMQFFSGCIRKYTDGYQNKNSKKADGGNIMLGIMKSPDYSFKNVLAMFVNGCAKSTKLWPELLQIDLEKELRNVQVPYMILQGDTDIVTSSAIIKGIVENCQNTNLQYRKVGNCGHFPTAEGMEAVLEALIEVIGNNKSGQASEE